MNDHTETSTERIIDASGLRLCTQSFGDPADPVIVLIMAAYWQGIAWPDAFCRTLADAGRFVIRFDHRDTGRSSVVDFDAAPYTLADMADDVLGILEAYGVERAHLVGASMGGMIAQEFALRHPARTATVTSLASTPLSHSYASGTSPEELPGPDAVAWSAFETVAGPGAGPTREQYAGGWTDFSRGVNGSAQHFDEESTRELHERSFDRASSADAVWNHMRATQATPDRSETLGALAAPLLVLHGSEDHVIPVAHGHRTAELVPGSTLHVIEGQGHIFDAAALQRVTEAILDHTGA